MTMLTPVAVGAPAVGAEQDAFLALVLDDEELLEAEFEALVAAAWSPVEPGGPPDVPVPAPRGGIPGRWSALDDRGAQARPGGARPGTDGWGRERSPPG